MTKVLLVAPVPSHPSTTGASARIRHMAEALQSLGHEVHFLHLQQPLRTASRAMHDHWQDRLHVFRGLSPASWVARGRRKVVRAIGKTLHLNLPVDSYFDPASAGYVRQLVARHRFDVAILSYVFYSRLLESMPAAMLKVIDTHDVFADRYRLYRAHGQPREFFSTSPAGERRALDRADIALAIQDSDAVYFRSLTKRRVVVVGHLAAPAVTPEPSATAPVMLFVGSAMGINTHGIAWFVDRVLPAVRREVPDAELWLVGSICGRFKGARPGIRRWGLVDPLDDLYRRSAVVINPQQFGTGLSIKCVDALLHGRPLVTTISGARGLEDGAGTAFLQAGSAEEFAELLVRLLRDAGQQAALGARALEFAREYHRRNLQALAAALSLPAAP
jgi:glycosyltransferase involved in cell wall biosynthesis